MENKLKRLVCATSDMLVGVFLKILKESNMKYFCSKSFLMLAMALKSINGLCQDLDSASIILATKTTLFLDFNVQNVPNAEELKCFVANEDNPFEYKELKFSGFKNFIFISAILGKKEFINKSTKGKCKYRINDGNKEYVIAFDIKHRKAYKIKGFYSNDFIFLFQDYLYLNASDFPKKGKKIYFQNNFSIDSINIKQLLK